MPVPPYRPNRRTFLMAGAATIGLAACAKADLQPGNNATPDPSPTSAAIGGPGSTAPPTSATTAPSSLAPDKSTTQSSASSTTSQPSASSTSPAGAGPATFITHGTAASAIGLTFHTNGDLGLAQRLLDILAEHRAHATNFVVGNWLDDNPTWGRKLTDAGHELANHTYTHPTFTSLSPTAMAAEITRCRDALARASGGGGGRYFRPSGTDDGLAPPNAAVMKAATDAGYAYVVGWDVEPFDYKDPGASAVKQRVLAGAKAGSIVSMHFGHPGTVEALPSILDGLAGMKLSAVTLSQLLG